jgi:hypothetical protein
MFSPNKVPTVSKKALQVQQKFRRDAFILELVELRRAARSLCESTGKTRGYSATHSSERRRGQRRRGKWLWRRFGVESEPKKRDATTTSALNFYVKNQNLLLAAAAGKSTTGVDRQ